ncbi:MAG: SDR family NAD(P)-dependent oxidoreductase [Spirochaetales bacterium]|nr:SDR family NAD(P)-dependent oxidoreductase [Spirochaetales bacterium]
MFSRRKRDLRGTRALLTGAFGNLGRALSFELARRGCEVIGVDRDRDALRLLGQEFAELGFPHSLEVIDLADSRALGEFLSRQLNRPLDILILNAGITRIRSFSQTDEVDFRSVMEVNFFAPVRLVSECLDRLPRTKGSLLPSDVASRVVAALEARKSRLYLPLQSLVARLIWGLSPDLYISLMKRRA